MVELLLDRGADMEAKTNVSQFAGCCPRGAWASVALPVGLLRHGLHVMVALLGEAQRHKVGGAKVGALWAPGL